MGDAIKLSRPDTKQTWELPVLFEDPTLLILDKPSGLPAISDALLPAELNLLKLLHEGIAAGRSWATARALEFLRPAHQLDPDESGIIIFGKSAQVVEKLVDLFRVGKARREFHVLVRGRPENEPLEIAAKLGTDQRREGFMRVDSHNGKRAQTSCSAIEHFKGFTLLRCKVEGDRRHQLRVHLRWARLPIVGDSLYRCAPLWLSDLKRGYRLKPNEHEKALIPRAAIHLAEVEFAHPSTGEALRFTAPLAHDMEVGLKYLRRYAAALPEVDFTKA